LPVDELRPAVVGIGVVVEEVRDRELAGDKGDPRDVLLSSDLIGTVLDGFPFAAEAMYTRARLKRGIGKLAFCASVLGKPATPTVSLSPKPWVSSGLM
jgi:hypothetical protein